MFKELSSLLFWILAEKPQTWKGSHDVGKWKVRGALDLSTFDANNKVILQTNQTCWFTTYYNESATIRIVACN
jgi:hypothetical protein